MLRIRSTGQNAKLEKEIGFELVVCADDLELLRQLDQAAEKGELEEIAQIEGSTCYLHFTRCFYCPIIIQTSCFQDGEF